ncbi:MAG: helix-turn-helix domain-containing protein [Christensenellaceae bacterium]|jgi:transcriptional regulator with XRE-family HTH domain|nr:helix-turn-helix domain-containing protein [Christensenellaceae bacterium]
MEEIKESPEIEPKTENESKDRVLAKIVAKNLVAFRRHAGLTQLELAEKLKYSDKSISKWERGEGLPDVTTLKELADLYSTTVDALLSPSTRAEKSGKMDWKDVRKRRFIISVLAVVFVWMMAVSIYSCIVWVTERPENFWLIFIYAIPISATVLYIFNIIWRNKLFNIIVISVIGWSLALSVFLSISGNYLWLMFVIAAAFQVLVLVWMFYLREKLRKKRISK